MKVRTAFDTQPAADQRVRTRAVWRWIGGVGIALALFDFASPFFAYARRGFVSDRRSHPPIFGSLHPRVHWGMAFAVVLGIAALVAVAHVARRRVPPWMIVAGGCVYLFAFSVAVAFIQARSLAVWGVRAYLDRNDVFVAKGLGARGFVKAYPNIVADLRSIHAVTHPAGRTLAALVTHNVAPGSLALRATFLASLAALLLIPAWFLARKVAGERAALFTVALLAVAPAPVMMGFLSYEAIEAVIFTGVIALFVWGGFWDDDERPSLAVAGGFLLGLASFMTFAVAFIAMFAVILAFWARPWRSALRLLAFAAVGGVAALVVLRLLVGFNFLTEYRASHDALKVFLRLNPKTPGFGARPYWYWVFGNPAVWLTFAGLPIAALAVRELFTKRPKYLLAMLVPVGIFYLLPASLTRIIPGEVERTIQYALPLAAVAAAAGLVRAEADDPRLPVILVAIAIVQTLVLQTLFFTFW